MKPTWKTCFKIATTVFIFYLCVHFLPAILSFGSDLLGAMKSMIIGAIIAYLVNLLMRGYEKHYFPKWKDKRAVAKTRRPICILFAFLTLIALIALICLLIIPELVSCIQTLVAVVPPFIQKMLSYAEDISWIPQQIITALEAIDWKSWISKIAGVLSSGMGDIVTFITSAVASTFSVIITILFSLIFSIYLLSGKDSLAKNTVRLMEAYLPKKPVKIILYLASVLNDCFQRYIVGQCIEALILGALCTIGMFIFDLPYATMIGALIAFTALIPIAGAYIGAGVGAFMILTVSPSKALFFLIFLLILQQLEGNLIYPRVVGTSLGLPAAWVLFAVTVGGGLYGVTGMLLGVPLVAAAYRLVKEDLARREDTAMKADALLSAAGPAPAEPIEEPAEPPAEDSVSTTSAPS